MFVFEDIAHIPDQAIAQIMAGVDIADQALALRGVTKEVRERLLSVFPNEKRLAIVRGEGKYILRFGLPQRAGVA